ncbi:MAG: hypothetical protein AAF828_12480 [Bacteroidota bacterium]
MRWLLLSFLFLLVFQLFGQQQLPGNQNIYDAQGPGFIYDKETTFHFGLATPRNLQLGVKFATTETYFKSKFISFELGDIRHSRELRSNFERIIIATNRVSRPFIYGKQNQLYVLRASFGNRIYVSEKAKQRGVAIGYSWQIGPSIGLLKPYYLEIETGEVINSGTVRDIRYSEEMQELFLDRFRIFGASSWSRGLDEIQFVPGIHAKASMHFGFGAFDELAKSFEVGIQGDFFFGDVPILVESDLTPGVTNSNLYLGLFMQMQIGKRY